MRLAEVALREQRLTASGAQLVFACAPGVERSLEQLVRLERDCCAFARLTVSRREDEVILDVTATGAGVAAVHALFDRAEQPLP